VIGKRLDDWAAAGQGCALHDRRVPGTKANIDHVAVGAGAVWVIDAKRYQGLVEHRDRATCGAPIGALPSAVATAPRSPPASWTRWPWSPRRSTGPRERSTPKCEASSPSSAPSGSSSVGRSRIRARTLPGQQQPLSSSAAPGSTTPTPERRPPQCSTVGSDLPETRPRTKRVPARYRRQEADEERAWAAGSTENRTPVGGRGGRRFTLDNDSYRDERSVEEALSRSGTPGAGQRSGGGNAEVLLTAEQWPRFTRLLGRPSQRHLGDAPCCPRARILGQVPALARGGQTGSGSS